MIGSPVCLIKNIIFVLTLTIIGLGTTACQNSQTITFIIPSGTQTQLAAGKEVVDFPSELNLTVGDTIIIENQDNVVHAFGPFTVLPQTTLTKRFETAKVYENTCTFHQDKHMKLVVNSSGWNIFQ